MWGHSMATKIKPLVDEPNQAAIDRAAADLLFQQLEQRRAEQAAEAKRKAAQRGK